MLKLTPRGTLSAGAVVPVIAIDDLNTTVDSSHALVEDGVSTLETILRTPVGLDAVRLIVKEVSNAIVGASMITNPEQFKVVKSTGTVFATSLGLHESLVRTSHNSGIPLIPGVATPGRVQLALGYGIDTLKLLPAEVVSGKVTLKAFYGPYANVRFCPTSDTSLVTALDYPTLPNVLCVGDSWLTPEEAMKNRDWDTVTRLAREASVLKVKAQLKAMKGRLKTLL